MSGHEQFADDLALYALELLEGEPLAVLEKHLAECPACRRELEHLRGDMALMALSTAGPAPPRRARQRLLAALAREPRLKVVPERRSAWSLVGVAGGGRSGDPRGLAVARECRVRAAGARPAGRVGLASGAARARP